MVHELPTLVGQRVCGIALGYEDLNDHDHLRHDPILALLSDQLEAKRKDCAVLSASPPRSTSRPKTCATRTWRRWSHDPAVHPHPAHADWFWGETAAGALLLALHPVCLASPDARVRHVGTSQLVPRAERHRL